MQLEDDDRLHLIPVDEDEENQCIRLLSFCKKHRPASSNERLVVVDERIASQCSDYSPPPNPSGCARSGELSNFQYFLNNIILMYCFSNVLLIRIETLAENQKKGNKILCIICILRVIQSSRHYSQSLVFSLFTQISPENTLIIVLSSYECRSKSNACQFDWIIAVAEDCKVTFF